MIRIPDNGPVLSGCEAALFLRLIEADAEPDEVSRGVEAVKRLVRGGRIRPLRSGRSYTYARAELERYVRDETESFTPTTET